MTEQAAGMLHILIIEDSYLCSMMLEDFMEQVPWKGGKEVVVCDTARKAMAHLEERKKMGKPSLPSFIIMDLELPDMHGIQILSFLKKDPDLKDIPVIVNTESKKSEDLIQSYREGAVAFLRKGSDEVVFQQLVTKLRVFGVI